MMNKELNNGRLAMIAMAGVLLQEYATGVPCTVAFVDWLDKEGLLQIILSPYEITQGLLSLPRYIIDQVQSTINSGSSAPSSTMMNGEMMKIPNFL
jgi:Chlorophyll A-B binding protein